MSITDNLLSQINIAKIKLRNDLGMKGEYLSDLFEDIMTEISAIDTIYKQTEHQRDYNNAQLTQRIGIIDALSEEFSAIYIIPCDTKTVHSIKKQSLWPKINIPEGEEWNYDKKLKLFISSYVHPDDMEDLLKILDFDYMYQMLQNQSFYYHHLRIMQNDEVHYYYVKVSRVQCRDDIIDAIMIGLICEDESKERDAFRALSETDIMTGLYNRGTGENKTRKLIASAVPGMFCMMDLDHFKTINDTCGHMIGDDVLIRFAKELKSAFRDDDIVFRLGGDEFAVYAPGVLSRRVGLLILKKLIARLNSISIPELTENNIKIEVSIGAIITSGSEKDFESIYNRADTSVYISKKGAGNAITFCPDAEYTIVSI